MGFLTPYYEKVNASRRHQIGLVLKQWRGFLEAMGMPLALEALHTDPTTWEGVRAETVLHYRQRLLNEGRSDATIERHLVMLRVVLNYAQQAGAVFPPGELELIAEIRGVGGRRGRPIPYPPRDKNSNVPQEADLVLSETQAYHLKHTHPDTPHGHRDALLMCLLLDHGLRASDISKLGVQDIDLNQGVLGLHHPKTDTYQPLSLSQATLHALHAYLADRTLPQYGHLFRILKRDGTLGKTPLFPRDLTERVKVLGVQFLGIAWLTPQVCYSYWLQSHTPSHEG